MNTPATIIRADGSPLEELEFDWPAHPGLDRLKAVIGPYLDGQPLEHVTVLHEDERRDMFVDECGALNGLPRNERATVIYRTNWLTQHPEADPESLPAIYGDAVLFKRQVWF